MAELSPEERETLERLAEQEPSGVFDRRTLSELSEKGFASFSVEGWEITELGERAISRVYL